MTSAGASPLVFLVAGEASGDALGADLMASLIEADPDTQFAGVGGPQMAERGLSSLFSMSDLSVMGLAEVLPRLPLILRRLNETVAAVEKLRPDVVVTIDSPDFCFRVAKRLKARGFSGKLVHYVAPSVWAWRPGRAKKIAALYDHLLCLLPFEPPYFEAEGLAATFVGHPIARGHRVADGQAFRRRHVIGDQVPLLVVLPGSRLGEIKRLLPVFGAAVRKLRVSSPDLRIAVPTLEHLEAEVRAACSTWPGRPLITTSADEKSEIFAAADLGLAASGTVGLELAQAGVPHVIGYKVSPLTAWLARRLIRVDFVHLANLLVRRQLVPERLQEACTADTLAADLQRLLTEPQARLDQQAGFQEAMGMLKAEGSAPLVRAVTAPIALPKPG